MKKFTSLMGFALLSLFIVQLSIMGTAAGTQFSETTPATFSVKSGQLDTLVVTVSPDFIDTFQENVSLHTTLNRSSFFDIDLGDDDGSAISVYATLLLDITINATDITDVSLIYQVLIGLTAENELAGDLEILLADDAEEICVDYDITDLDEKSELLDFVADYDCLAQIALEFDFASNELDVQLIEIDYDGDGDVEKSFDGDFDLGATYDQWETARIVFDVDAGVAEDAGVLFTDEMGDDWEDELTHTLDVCVINGVNVLSWSYTLSVWYQTAQYYLTLLMPIFVLILVIVILSWVYMKKGKKGHLFK